MKKSLGRQIFNGFLLVSTIPLAALGAYGVLGARNAALEHAATRLADDANLAVAHVNSFLDLHAAGVAVAAGRGADSTDLRAMRASFPGFISLTRYGTDGRVQVRFPRESGSAHDPNDAVATNHGLIRLAMSSRVPVVGIAVLSPDADPTLTIAAGHHDARGQVDGAIVGSLRPGALGAVGGLFATTRLVAFADSLDRVLYASPGLGLRTMARLPARGSEGRIRLGSEWYRVAGARGMHGFQAVVWQAEAAILAEQGWFRATYLAGVVLVLLFGVGLSVVLGRRLAAPLEAVAEWARTYDVDDPRPVPAPPRHAPRELVALNDHLEASSRRLVNSFTRLEGVTRDREVLNQQLTAVLRDLDRQVEQRTEALGHALRAAEQANLTKSRFLANMSHELRTPLNSVIGFASLLRKNRHAVLAPRDLDMLDRIQANGRHLLALINDVLDLSKVEAGRMTLSLAPVDVSAIVRQVVADAETQVGNKPVVVRWTGPGRSVIETDEAKVRQVLVNLVTNAVKFTDRGEVCVSLTDGTPIELRVSDSGIGIAPDRLDAIFRPFEQAEANTSTRYGGTGLGLSISRSMAEMLGGSLMVESTPGLGSTFTFRVPVGVSVPVAEAVDA